MPNPIVLISTVADGSMYNRKDLYNAAVIENRTKFLAQHNITIDDATRLHPNANQRAEVDHETNWCRYIEIDTSSKGLGMRGDDAPTADAIITKDAHHALLLPVADCVGATIYDPVHHVLMISHLGRHSLEQQGGVRSVEHLTEHYGSDPKVLLVWFTPAPNKEVFPIWALDNKGMKEVAFEQMAAAGVPFENITDNPADTATDLTYYSYSEYLKGHREEDGDHAMITMMTD
jgi:copper oxidase (laccase) domain-containing protein